MLRMQSHKTRKFGGCPWRYGKNYDNQPICTLHQEIEDFYDYMSATPEEHCMRLGVLERVTNTIQAKWPEAKVEVFGSFPTGLYLPTSDMDLVVIGEWDTLPLHSLAQDLLKSGVCSKETIQILDKASVPIIKMTDKATDVKVDISFNINNGVKSNELIKHYMDVFPMLPKLVFVLKQFLVQRDMNEVFYGGISTYSLIYMVVSFLQLHPRGELNYSTVNLGVLLMEFFELYGKNFDYMRTAIRLKDGGQHIPKDEVQKNMADGFRPGILCIEDVLAPGNNIGRGSYNMLLVKNSFEYAFNTLTAALDPQVASPRYSILGQIVQVNDKVILSRQWIRDTYALQSIQRIVINNYLRAHEVNNNNASVSINTIGTASPTVSSDSESAESDSEISTEVPSGHGNHDDRNDNCEQHRYRSQNNRNNFQRHNQMTDPGTCTSTRNQRLMYTRPGDNYRNRGFYNYKNHQNYREKR